MFSESGRRNSEGDNQYSIEIPNPAVANCDLPVCACLPGFGSDDQQHSRVSLVFASVDTWRLILRRTRATLLSGLVAVLRLLASIRSTASCSASTLLSSCCKSSVSDRTRFVWLDVQRGCSCARLSDLAYDARRVIARHDGMDRAIDLLLAFVCCSDRGGSDLVVGLDWQ